MLIICDVCVLLLQLANTSTEQEFHDLLSSEEYEFRYTCGISKPATCIKFPEKLQLISAMCLHYSVLVSLAELQQLRRGLAIQKFDSLMQSFRQLIRKAFQPPECKVTSDYLQDLFAAEFSPRGSNQREIEEAIMMTWIR